MVEGSLITDELRKLIGVPVEPTIYRVEEGAIRRYAEAIGDQNPLYSDADLASKSRNGRVICPPGFMGWPVKGKLPVFKILEAMAKAGAPPRGLDGGIEFEFLVPICAGDTLVATTKITNIAEREAKSGKMMFATVETTFLNQNGDMTLKSRATFINY